MDSYDTKDCRFVDDNELLRRLKEADRAAFAEIYTRYHAMLYTYALYYMKSRPDVEDILQSVFVKLWTAREAIFVTASLRSYLFAMTKNRVMNYIRDSNNALQHNYRLAQQQPDCDDDLCTRAERNHLTEVLHLAIKSLPPQQQLVATLRCQGYSNREIAERLDLSVNTVNAHYRACLKRLKECVPGFIELFIAYLFFNSTL